MLWIAGKFWVDVNDPCSFGEQVSPGSRGFAAVLHIFFFSPQLLSSIPYHIRQLCEFRSTSSFYPYSVHDDSRHWLKLSCIAGECSSLQLSRPDNAISSMPIRSALQSRGVRQLLVESVPRVLTLIRSSSTSE